MDVIDKVEGWFDKQKKSLQKILTKIQPIVEKVLPIVTEISTVVGDLATQDDSAVLAKIASYLGTAVTDAPAVEAFIAKYAALPVDVLLRDAAAFVLQHVHGTLSTVASDINLAIETALALNKAD